MVEPTSVPSPSWGEKAPMVRLGELMMILELHRQGLTITAIARRTGRDPKTVRKYIESGIEAPVYGPRSVGRPSKLAPFMGFLRERGVAFPDLSRAAIAGALALELAMRFLVGLGFLERGDLRLGQQDAILCRLGFERFEAVLHRGQVVALPHAAHADGRDRQPAPLQRLRDAHLAPGRLLDRHCNDRFFDLR